MNDDICLSGGAEGDDENTMKPLGDNICLSGGAKGSDEMWGSVSGTFGHSVFHLHFKGHKSYAPKSELVELTKAQLIAADEHVSKANLVLKRRFPTSKDFVNNLLRRNWYQVETAESCYAIATIKNGQVQGGTAWAVTMFIDKYDGKPCACYVFCQEAGKWFKWEGAWQEIGQPPVPTGIWAGIGSRELKDNGKEAIRKLFGWKNEKNKNNLHDLPETNTD